MRNVYYLKEREKYLVISFVLRIEHGVCGRSKCCIWRASTSTKLKKKRRRWALLHSVNLLAIDTLGNGVSLQLIAVSVSTLYIHMHWQHGKRYADLTNLLDCSASSLPEQLSTSLPFITQTYEAHSFSEFVLHQRIRNRTCYVSLIIEVYFRHIKEVEWRNSKHTHTPIKKKPTTDTSVIVRMRMWVQSGRLWWNLSIPPPHR